MAHHPGPILAALPDGPRKIPVGDSRRTLVVDRRDILDRRGTRFIRIYHSNSMVAPARRDWSSRIIIPVHLLRASLFRRRNRSQPRHPARAPLGKVALAGCAWLLKGK